jgi:hypothetical protein
MTQMVARHTSMSINDFILAKVPVWQAFQAEIDSISMAPRIRRTRERLRSNAFIESAQSIVVTRTRSQMRASDKTLASSRLNRGAPACRRHVA